VLLRADGSTCQVMNLVRLMDSIVFDELDFQIYDKDPFDDHRRVGNLFGDAASSKTGHAGALPWPIGPVLLGKIYACFYVYDDDDTSISIYIYSIIDSPTF
jgi:hypothetical protein